MKFKLYSKDGSSLKDATIDNFPTLPDGKGVDALRQCVLAVQRQCSTGKCINENT